MSHGIGPHQDQSAAAARPPSGRVKELYGAIEEAARTMTGLFMLGYLATTA